MEYVLGLFADQAAAKRAADALKSLGLGEHDYHIRTHAHATRSLKGWAEWLFDMPEPLSGMEGEGLPHEAGQWYESKIEAGDTMVAARVQDRRGAEIARALRQAGGHDVRRYEKRAEGWTQFTGDDEAKPEEAKTADPDYAALPPAPSAGQSRGTSPGKRYKPAS
jgi:hypothetical protein